MKTILTGIQPSGELTLGNYFGAVVPAVDLQNRGAAYYFLADYHALTTVHEAQTLRGWTFNLAGRLRGTNDLSCAFISYYEFIGTCNNGINYGLCNLDVNADICGTDGTTYSFSNDGTYIRSSFGSRCNISSTSTEIFFNC